MRGKVSISGLLDGNLATINFAETAEVLDVGYERIEGYLDGKSIMIILVLISRSC